MMRKMVIGLQFRRANVPKSWREEKEIIGPKGQLRIECEPYGYGGGAAALSSTSVT